MIEVEDLSVCYGDHEALRGLSFQVSEGEFFGLLGPNGAGKTTAISALCGLLGPRHGAIRIAGVDSRAQPRRARAWIGLVPQHLAFYPSLSARQNLEFFGRLHGCWGDELERRVGEALELASLTERAEQPVATYSGGMKRRLNVAIGLLHRPRILILDEPTVGVDAQSRSSMLADFEEIRRRGTTILYTTHLMEEARRLCDRIAILDAGRIVAIGSPAELIGRYGRAIVRARFAEPPPPGFVAGLCTDLRLQEATQREGWLDLATDEGARAVAALTGRAEAAGLEIREIELVEPDLDSVFLALTGRELRD